MTQLTLDEAGRRRAVCPACRAEHALTLDGRLWTHGALDRRCRGSQRTPEGARAAARRPQPITRRRRARARAVQLELGPVTTRGSHR